VTYTDFIANKSRTAPPVGIAEPPALPSFLFPFQADCVRWALRRGRAALFEDCGLGKSPQQLVWSSAVERHMGSQVLIIAPLAVAQQTVREGEKFGIPVTYAQNQAQADGPIVITNYERMDAFQFDRFAGLTLDESSILKALDGKTKQTIIDVSQPIPFRLACTATPAPNDYVELGNHAEFLGVMTRAEMLSMYFVHDGGSTQDWRIKGHAEADFWRWVCSWAVMLRRPSDLGYPDDGFVLPPLEIHEHVVAVDHTIARKAGMLFAMEAVTLQEQRAVRRGSIDERVALAASICDDGQQWLMWVGLNDEGDALTAAISGAVQVSGNDTPEHKIQAALDFQSGKVRVLVSKGSIFGFGLNFQNAHKMAFVGIGHSYEQFYQSVRREWRFGQQHPVDAHIIITETEGRVAANLKRKEADAKVMADAMLTHMRDIQSAEIKGTQRTMTGYDPAVPMVIPAWLTAYAQEPG
jgi:hypothetical protein